jgi:hypothetical protein
MKANFLFLTENFNESVFMREDIKKFYSNIKYYQLIYSSEQNDNLDYLLNYDFCFDFNYVGSLYRKDILDVLKKDSNYVSLIQVTPPVINEIKRVNSFCRAKVNLVFHSESNGKNGVITERFAEALSYGNIIFHDNLRIKSLTGHLPGCIYINSYDDLEQKYNEIRSLNIEEINEMVKLNRYFWSNSDFTYRKQASNIIKTFQ